MGVKVRPWKGAWWIFIDHRGTRKAKRCASKRAAELAADKIDAALKLGQTDLLAARPAAVPTFAEYAERWLQSIEATRVRPVTAADYRIRLRVRLLPLIGALPLTAITRERVRAAIGELAAIGNQRTTRKRPLARATLKVTLTVLHAILARAVEEELIPRNPAAGLAREIRATTATEAAEVEVFTREELTRLLAAAEQDWPAWHPFLFTLTRAGLRLGEAVGLEWRDVDFERRMLIIRRTERRGQISVPKSGKTRRVDMSRQLGHVLAGFKTLQEAEAALAGTPAPERVFSMPNGAAVHDDSFRNHVWAPILRRAGLRYRKPHTLRHTFASLLIEAGESLKYAQEQLGHHSPAFTLAVYGHLIPRGDRRAVDRLDDATIRHPRATEVVESDLLPNDPEEIHREVSNLAL